MSIIQKIYFLAFYISFKSLSAFSMYNQLPQNIKNFDEYFIVNTQPYSSSGQINFLNSVHFEWQQLSQLGEQSRGYLKKDLISLAKDLSDLGLNPRKKIIIVGRGLNGRGEEGRIAYTLIKSGFKKVFISTAEELRRIGFKQTHQIPMVPKKQQKFLITSSNGLNIEKNEVIQLLKKNNFLPCIDVRPDNFPAEKINNQFTCPKIYWAHFFNKDMSISELVSKKLEEKNMKTSDRIIILSEAGLASSGVLLALRKLKYKNAVVFEGGYAGLRALSQSLQ